MDEFDALLAQPMLRAMGAGYIVLSLFGLWWGVRGVRRKAGVQRPLHLEEYAWVRHARQRVTALRLGVAQGTRAWIARWRIWRTTDAGRRVLRRLRHGVLALSLTVLWSGAAWYLIRDTELERDLRTTATSWRNGLGRPKPTQIASEPAAQTVPAPEVELVYPPQLAPAAYATLGRYYGEVANREWRHLDHAYAEKAIGMLYALERRGYQFTIIEGTRDPVRVAAAHKQMPVPSASSTNSHVQGRAADFGWVDAGGKVRPPNAGPGARAAYQALGEAARAAGFIWGGDLAYHDLTHVEAAAGTLPQPSQSPQQP